MLWSVCHHVSASHVLQVEASCMDDDLGGGKHAAVSKPRRRQYRVKSST